MYLLLQMQGILGLHNYPFLVVANHLTLMLIEVFKLRDSRFLNSHTVFWNMFEEGGEVFEEVFAHVLAFVDRLWIERRATLEEFPLLIQESRHRIENVLGECPTSLPHFQHIAENSGLYID